MPESKTLLDKIKETAEAKARELRTCYISTEHLLLAVLEEGGIATKVLNNFGISERRIVETINELFTEDDYVDTPSYTMRGRRAIETATQYARSLNQDLNEGHVLYGAIESEDGVASQILASFGASNAELKKEIHSLLTTKKSTMPSRILDPSGKPFFRQSV